MVLFTDLGVKWKEDTPVDDKIRRLIKLGYRQVAINNAVLPPPTGKTKGKGENQKKQLKDPRDILLPEHKLRLHSNVQLIDTGSKLKQLSRLTLIFSKAEQVHNLHSADIQAYDILAVQPSDKDLFHMACQTLEVDIISLDLSEPLPFNVKYPSLHAAYERGIHFEIQYGPLIRDQEARKNIITNVQTLIEVGKGKNLILTSGCENPLDLRGPYDVRVLGLMLGLSELKVRAALTTNCQSVLSHAAARKSGRSMVSVMKLDDVEEKNAWIAKATDTDLLDEGSSAEDSSSSDNSDDDDDDDDSDDEGNTKRAPKDVCSPKRKKRKL
ncbi:P subunit p30-like [Octopus vulgaris]|uniref:P subunit p30-like n=1 Tax=Octopus vulgaris TaxID=6645 RepID=A0AA36FFC3_OCTVU|nr:P subunit p30-like [Octopus vulgaris]